MVIQLEQDRVGIPFQWSHRHRKHLKTIFRSLTGKSWSLDLPVVLLNRCWLRLEEIKLKDLAQRLPPDNSKEAPELVRYRHLLSEVGNSLLVLQQCWNEFGIEDFHRALRNSWYWEDVGNNGWTFEKYSQLIEQYRTNIDQSHIAVPLIVLARENSGGEHQLSWIIDS